MSGVNAHAVLDCPVDDAHASPPTPLLWRRRAFGMPWPVPSGHLLLYTAAAMQHSGSEGLARFTVRLDRPCVAFLRDHTVHSAALLPAAAMCEAASAAGGALLRATRRRVAVLAATIAAPLRLPAASVGDAGIPGEAHLNVDVRAGTCKLASAGAGVGPSATYCHRASAVLFWHDQIGSSGAASTSFHNTLADQAEVLIDEQFLASQVGCIWMPALQSCSRPLSLVRSKSWQPGCRSGSPVCNHLCGRPTYHLVCAHFCIQTWRAGSAWTQPQQMHACISAQSSLR